MFPTICVTIISCCVLLSSSVQCAQHSDLRSSLSVVPLSQVPKPHVVFPNTSASPRYIYDAAADLPLHGRIASEAVAVGAYESYSDDDDVVEGRGKKGKFKVKKKYKKYLLPLLIAYKLKFFTLVPVIIAGLLLLTGSTGMAGFFFALFISVMVLKTTGK